MMKNKILHNGITYCAENNANKNNKNKHNCVINVYTHTLPVPKRYFLEKRFHETATTFSRARLRYFNRFHCEYLFVRIEIARDPVLSSRSEYRKLNSCNLASSVHSGLR